MKRRWRNVLLAAALAVLTLASAPSFARDTVVFAAASLKNALDDAVAAYEKTGGGKVVVSYAASSALAKQMESGAAADIFISADLDWMNDVEKHDLIDKATRKNFLGNAIVLIAPTAAHAARVDIKPGFDLRGLLKDGRLAMADPASVPAGKYGEEALTRLGVWDSVKDKVASAENVRGALLFVDRGEAPYGIVYATDAAADKKVEIVGSFPESSHKPVIYPVAATAHADAEARKFLGFLESPAARPAFEKQGFTLLP
ncbi:MAG TPA: molybdate ABC transporter substrate-binding protein [Stellaceae bacterium]|nr:molybdate ABC transporter substrate-binding protein [Stellaceae bacterium]